MCRVRDRNNIFFDVVVGSYLSTVPAHNFVVSLVVGKLLAAASAREAVAKFLEVL